MNSLIRLCVGRPVTVIMAIMALFLAGFFSINMLSLDKLPEISYPRVTVETIYSGMGAKDVRSIITIPVEDALSSVKGLERIRSISRDGASVVVLDFKWGVDPNSASVLVREAIDAVYPSLPEGILKPIVVPGDPNEEPHAIISVASRLDDGSFARNLAEYELRARFRRIDGVGAVILVGGEIPEAKVKLDVPRALPRGIGAGELAQVMASETADIPAGNAREGDMELVVISSGRPNSVEELSHLILPTETGPLHISDIATISQETARRNSVFLFNNKEQVALEIYRRSGADPVKLSKEIKKTLDETIPVFSRDAEIKLVYDTSGDILKGIHDLARSALLGATAVFLTLLFFIRSIRYSLLTALSIPISAAAAITMLAITGKSLNSMSLSGLALGIGLVSDTSVVVLDLLHRTFDNYSKRPLPAEIGDCVSSVSGSSFASTVTTAVVFIPIVFLPGPLGALFGDMSISLVSSIAAGWLFAQLGLPSLYRIFYKKGKKETKIFKFEQIYDHGLKISMQRPFAILFIAIFLSIIGIAILFTRPASFVSPDDATEIEVAISFPPGTDLKYVGNNGILILKILNQFT